MSHRTHGKSVVAKDYNVQFDPLDCFSFHSSISFAFDLMPNFKQGMGPQVPEFDYSIDDETDHIANSATIRAPVSSGAIFAKGTVVKVNNPPFLPYSE